MILYSYITFLLCHQQQQMGTKRETHSQTLLRVRDLGTLSPKRNVYIKSPLRAQGTPRKRKKECMTQRGWRASRKQLKQGSSEFRYWSSMNRACTGNLHVYDSCESSGFMGFLGLWLLWPLLVSFPFVGLSCPTLMWNFLIFLIIFFKKMNECKHSYLGKS